MIGIMIGIMGNMTMIGIMGNMTMIGIMDHGNHDQAGIEIASVLLNCTQFILASVRARHSRVSRRVC